MNHLRFELGGKRDVILFPENWDELSTSQLHRLIPILSPMAKLANQLKGCQLGDPFIRQLDRRLQELRLKAFWVLLDLPWWSFKRQRLVWSIYPDELAEVLKCTDFLLKDPERTVEPFKRLKLRTSELIGPGDRLASITAEEYHFATLKLKELAEANEDKETSPQALRRLSEELAYVLFRPKGSGPKFKPEHIKYCGDQRETFNRSSWEHRSRHFRFLKEQDLKLIVWWFGQMNLQLQKSHPRIFRKKKGAANRYGWLPVFRSMAKDPLKTTEIGKLKLNLLLFELNESIEEADRIKSKAN